MSGYYWSSSEVESYRDRAWGYDFWGAAAQNHFKSSTLYVRPVRAF